MDDVFYLKNHSGILLCQTRSIVCFKAKRFHSPQVIYNHSCKNLFIDDSLTNL